jgi:hypothetical protein
VNNVYHTCEPVLSLRLPPVPQDLSERQAHGHARTGVKLHDQRAVFSSGRLRMFNLPICYLSYIKHPYEAEQTTLYHLRKTTINSVLRANMLQ